MDNAKQSEKAVSLGNIFVGDMVVWRNEFGTIEGIFRGFTDNNQKVVIVANGSQVCAPSSEVFYDN